MNVKNFAKNFKLECQNVFSAWMDLIEDDCNDTEYDNICNDILELANGNFNNDAGWMFLDDFRGYELCKEYGISKPESIFENKICVEIIKTTAKESLNDFEY